MSRWCNLCLALRQLTTLLGEPARLGRPLVQIVRRVSHNRRRLESVQYEPATFRISGSHSAKGEQKGCALESADGYDAPSRSWYGRIVADRQLRMSRRAPGVDLLMNNRPYVPSCSIT